MRTFTVARLFEFDAAHRVLGHSGKCRYLHGHRYKAEVVVSSLEMNVLGMVVDFGDIKTIIGSWIDNNWDHNTILNPNDFLCTAPWHHMKPHPSWEDVFGRYPYFMPHRCPNPTVENMADVLYKAAVDLLHPIVGLKVSRIRLWETPNCYADFP